jgi:tetrahydromethanopterin S-methyltransferase subunit B
VNRSTEEETMPNVDEKLQRLEEAVDRAEAVLDRTHRALNAIDAAQQHADHVGATLRRAVILGVIGTAMVVGLMLVRRRTA